jgi:ABC-type multidrug transport system fused ATPase/permease subunit
LTSRPAFTPPEREYPIPPLHEERLRPAHHHQTMQLYDKLFLILGGQRGKALGLLFLMLLGAVFEGIGLGLVMPYIALLARADSRTLPKTLLNAFADIGVHRMRDILLWTGAALLLLNIGKNAYLAWLSRLQYRFLFRRQSELTRRLFEHYVRTPYVAFLQINSVEVIRILTWDCNYVFTNFIIPLCQVLTEAFVVLAILGLLLSFAPLPTMAAGAFLAIASLVFYRYVRRLREGLEERRTSCHENMMRWINQGLGGFKETKIMHREEFFVEAYSKHAREFERASVRLFPTGELPRLFTEATVVAGIVLVISIFLARGNDFSSSLPPLALVAAAAFRLMPSVNRILTGLHAMESHRHLVDTIALELRTDLRSRPLLPSTSSGNGPATLSFERKVELKEVGFQYPGTRAPALKGLSFTVPKGHSIGIVGTSGGGKSTAVDVLMGLLTPAQGEVLVDGVSIQSRLAQWGSKIGYIPQPVYVYDDSIRRNIAFGLEDDLIDDEKVWSALRTAQLEDFVRSLPEGLETRLGERGVRLSGGQRQRIGIARVLYHDPEVMVLDEATAGLDNETETEVAKAISTAGRHKTLVIVAHRLSTVRNCDTLFLLKNGTIVASGPYHELLETSADFKSLAAVELE